ncbi:MAG TPA: T9SS type A sorting domain-containing protein [Bacteroidia bacterium]|nr:T9SS type A sorting domain-containing protein [Bacteroidia bacterium]
MLRNIIVLLVLSINICHAQYKNSVWCFGDSARIDFVNGTATAGSSVVRSRGTCASIADSADNLLFYTAIDPNNVPLYLRKGTVYNKLNAVMDNGDTLVGLAWYNEHIIIPNPAGNNRFYIFHLTASLGAGGANNGLFYSVVDLNYNNGLGKVTAKNQHLITTDYLTDAMAAVKHGNGRDWWMVCKPTYSGATGVIPSDTLYVYLVTPDSIHAPMKQRIGYDKTTGLGNFTFSSDGSKLNFVSYGGSMQLFDFDRCTGLMSNANIITDSLPITDGAFLGSAFSPNDSLLYIIKGVYYPFYLLQYDIYSQDMDTIAQITGMQTVVNRGRSPGHIRLAPDGKIYMTASYTDTLGYLYFPYADSCYFPENMYLGVINNPNVKGVGCNFNNFGFYLGGKRTYWGLPNNPDYELGALQGSGCDTLTALKQDPEIAKNNLFVYPNPAKDFVTIAFSKAVRTTCNIRLFNVLNKEVYRQNFVQQKVTVPIANLAKGIYIVEVSNNGFKEYAKFVKE